MKKIVLAVIAILVVAGYVVATHLEGTLKSIIENAGTQALGTAVHVSGLDVSLADQTASVSGLSVANPSGFRGDFLKTKSISATLGNVESKTVTIKEIIVDGMTVTYELGPHGTNLDVLKRNLKSAPSGSSGPSSGGAGDAGSEKSGGYDVIIQQLRIVHAQVIPAIAGRGKAVNLPEIILTNIGSKNNPATPEQIAKQIMDHVIAVSSALALKSSLSSALPAGAADNAKNALKGLFSK